MGRRGFSPEVKRIVADERGARPGFPCITGCMWCARPGAIIWPEGGTPSLRGLEWDHIIAVARGGGNEEDNCAIVCIPCNRSKKDKSVADWWAYIHPEHAAKNPGVVDAMRAAWASA